MVSWNEARRYCIWLSQRTGRHFRLPTDGQRRTLDATHAEPAGYLACTQTPDGVIHLLSSRVHYRFNLKWIEQAP